MLNIHLNQERAVKELFNKAEIQIGGSHSSDIQVKDKQFYTEVLRNGSLGLGESYMAGDWECASLEDFFLKVFTANLSEKVQNNLPFLSNVLFAKLFNLQNISRSRQVARQHYDLSNEFYELMLGKSMAYTCAYWKDAKSLDEAQYAKYDLICKKLHLAKGENVLEHGCGWGGFAKFASENYGCNMYSVNISTEQVKYAKELNKNLPVKIFKCDYRDHKAYNPDNIKFDKVVSIGMAEHVGPKNYNTWFQIVHNQLKKDGLFLLHSIFSDVSLNYCDPFTHKYIFPNSVVPSLKQVSAPAEKLFVVEDLHNIGVYYYQTSKEWYNNFIYNWNNIQKLDKQFNETFFRMWSFYLGACMGIAKSKDYHLYQIVFSKRGNQNLYEPVR